MYNRQKEILFQQIVRSLPECSRDTLYAMFSVYQRQELYDRMREKEQLKKEVTEEVLSRISTTLDISDCLRKIDELQQALDNLCK